MNIWDKIKKSNDYNGPNFSIYEWISVRSIRPMVAPKEITLKDIGDYHIGVCGDHEFYTFAHIKKLELELQEVQSKLNKILRILEKDNVHKT